MENFIFHAMLDPFLAKFPRLMFARVFNPFQPRVAFHIETSNFICYANKTTGFYMKRNAELKWITTPLRNIT